MKIEQLLLVRREELHRHVNALPAEIAAWQQRVAEIVDLNVHASQLATIAKLLDVYTDRQRQLLESLDSAQSPEEFQEIAWQLMGQIVLAQSIWDYFRDKLELRFAPSHREVLWIADTVAWDAYTRIMERAQDRGALPKGHFREPPLTYLDARLSPMTLPRGEPRFVRRGGDSAAALPIPVIEIPWDHVENLWELLTILHEVGHDVERDLGLDDELDTRLTAELTEHAVPAERIRRWQQWRSEISADLIGLQLGGPAFVDVAMSLFLLPAKRVTRDRPQDPHPPAYLRIRMNLAYACAMLPHEESVQAYLAEREAQWLALYGKCQELEAYLADCAFVFQGLMDTPLDALQGSTMRDFVPFSAYDQSRIAEAAGYLLTGTTPPERYTIQPRHCISAARAAVTQAVEREEPLEQLLAAINVRTAELVHDNAKPGLRADESSWEHDAFVASFADKLALADDPFEAYGWVP